MKELFQPRGDVAQLTLAGTISKKENCGQRAEGMVPKALGGAKWWWNH